MARRLGSTLLQLASSLLWYAIVQCSPHHSHPVIFVPIASQAAFFIAANERTSVPFIELRGYADRYVRTLAVEVVQDIPRHVMYASANNQ